MLNAYDALKYFGWYEYLNFNGLYYIILLIKIVDVLFKYDQNNNNIKNNNNKKENLKI